MVERKLTTAGFDVDMSALRIAPIDPTFVVSLAAWTRKHRLNVLHSHELMMSFYAGAAGLLSGAPHVITMHGGKRFAEDARRRRALAMVGRTVGRHRWCFGEHVRPLGRVAEH